MLSFFYQNPPTAETLKDQILCWAISHLDDCGAADVTNALIKAYIAAVRFEDEDGDADEIELMNGPDAEKLSGVIYARHYGCDIEDIWNGNSGWTFPESLLYESDTSMLPRDIVITVTEAAAQRDKAVSKELAKLYRERQGAQS